MQYLASQVLTGSSTNLSTTFLILSKWRAERGAPSHGLGRQKQLIVKTFITGYCPQEKNTVILNYNDWRRDFHLRLQVYTASGTHPIFYPVYTAGKTAGTLSCPLICMSYEFLKNEWSRTFIPHLFTVLN